MMEQSNNTFAHQNYYDNCASLYKRYQNKRRTFSDYLEEISKLIENNDHNLSITLHFL